MSTSSCTMGTAEPVAAPGGAEFLDDDDFSDFEYEEVDLGCVPARGAPRSAPPRPPGCPPPPPSSEVHLVTPTTDRAARR